MTRSFIVNLAFLLLLNLLVKPISILLDIQVQNTVGPEEYGLYFAVFNFSYLFQIFLDLGINNYNNRSVAQDEGHIYRYLPSLFLLKLLLAVGYGVLTFVGGDALGFSPMQMHLLGWLIVNQFLLSMVLFLRSNLSGMHHFRVDSLLSVLDKLLLAIILLVLLYGAGQGENFRIEWFAYAQTASLGVTALVACGAVLYFAGKIRFKSGWGHIGQMLRETMPYALLGIFMTVYYRIDGVMIERMLPSTGAYEAGVYAACYRLLDAANIIGLLFAGLLLPIFSRMLANGEDAQGLLSFSFRTLVGGAIMVAILLRYFGEPLMGLLYSESTSYWGEVLRTLFWAYPGISVAYTYGTLMVAAGYLKEFNIITFVAMAANVALNWLLIPQFESLGATWASVATQVITSLGMIYITHRNLKAPFPVQDLVRMAFLAAIVFGAGQAITYVQLDWKIKLAMVSIIGTGAAFLLRVFEWKALLELVRRR